MIASRLGAAASTSDPGCVNDITVFTPYFAARTAERQAELDLCIAMNLRCDAISRLVLLVDDGHVPPVAHDKLKVKAIARRPTYRDWIELTRELPTGSISMLANSDIYFDETLPVVRLTLREPQRFLALSRFEQSGDGVQPHPNPHWSQDSWGLRAGQDLPVPLVKALDIPLGVPRCDNKVAYLFAVHGWTVHNPANLLRSVHVHQTQQRSYDKKTDMTVMGGVAYVHPVDAPEEPSSLEFDVWARRVQHVKSVKLNRSLDDWLSDSAAAPSPPMTVKPDASAQVGRATTVVAARLPMPTSMAVNDVGLVLHALRDGVVARSVRGRFKVYELDGRHMAVDSLSPAGAQWLHLTPPVDKALDQGEPLLLSAFVPPVLDTAPVSIGLKPNNKADCQFWQYPAATERQALENHIGLPRGANVDVASRVVHTYLGLPWATYIDKKQVPDEVHGLILVRIAGLRALARELNYELRVHTVCQQIHWRRLIDTFRQVGVTDLHLSHATTDINSAREGWAIRTYSWPLFAPNIEILERRVGLTIGKPLDQRRYLASFVGAHMSHYRSDVRVQLAEWARRLSRDDVLVELSDTWHFNRTVYEEQVQHKPLPISEKNALTQSARRYNEVLSDSIFSLCPEGAGPNTLRLWESLAVGAIPVIISERWQPPWLPSVAWNELAIFLNAAQLPSLQGLFDTMTERERRNRSAACTQAYSRARALTCFGPARV